MAALALSMAALAATAAAQTTVSLIAPDFTTIPLVGSVVAVGGDATTYAVACPDDSTLTACPGISTQTIVQGPSTWEMNYSVDRGTATNLYV